MSMVAVIHSDRNSVSIQSSSSRPRTAIGIEPTMISQPMRASGSECGIRPVTAAHHRPMMRVMSRQK